MREGWTDARSTDWVRLNIPPNTSVISGTGFYGSNDPTNSVKALKEDRSKGLGFNPIRSTPPCSQWYNNYVVWNKLTKYTQTQINLVHSEMGPVRQNPIQRTVRTAHLVCLWLCANSVHNTTQNSSDNLPSYLQTNIAQMLSTGGEGVRGDHGDMHSLAFPLSLSRTAKYRKPPVANS